MSFVLAAPAVPGVAAFTPVSGLALSAPLFVTTLGTTDVTADLTLVVCTLPGAGAASLQLPSGFPAGVSLMIVRADDVAAATLTILPNAGAQIDGGASITLDDTATAGGPSGVMIAYDGTDWWSTGATA